MAEAIHYCDSCSNRILPSDIEDGRALVTTFSAICPDCVNALPPEQREQLRAEMAKREKRQTPDALPLGSGAPEPGGRGRRPSSRRRKGAAARGGVPPVRSKRKMSPVVFAGIAGTSAMVVVTVAILAATGPADRSAKTRRAAGGPASVQTAPTKPMVSTPDAAGVYGDETPIVAVPEPEDADDRDYAAQFPLARARSHAKQNPDDVDGILKRFREVVQGHAGTPSAEEARVEVARWEKVAASPRLGRISQTPWTSVPESALTFGGHSYYLDDVRVPLDVARRQCEARGGYLAAVSSADENRFLTGLVRTTGAPAWIGIAREGAGAAWTWSNGEDGSFRNWASGEGGGSGAKGARISPEHDLKWADHAPDGSFAYICEWDAPPGAALFGGHWYWLSRDAVKWSEANKKCERLGGHLVTITSSAEHDFLARLVRRAGHGAWIGLTRELPDGSWGWMTGEAVSVTRWASTQPTNGLEDVVRMDPGRNCKWADHSRTKRYLVLCEWDRE